MTLSLIELQQAFDAALKSGHSKELERVFTQFDKYCRSQVDVENDEEKKRQLINRLLNTQLKWKSEILQLKAKVNDDLADIKLNARKINKYLTSY